MRKQGGALGRFGELLASGRVVQRLLIEAHGVSEADLRLRLLDLANDRAREVVEDLRALIEDTVPAAAGDDAAEASRQAARALRGAETLAAVARDALAACQQ